jgi:hypothetical protein
MFSAGACGAVKNRVVFFLIRKALIRKNLHPAAGRLLDSTAFDRSYG